MAEAQIFKALADDTRLSIVRFLLAGKKNASQIARHIKKSQPNTSFALRVLHLNRIVVSERRGREVVFSLRQPETVRSVIEHVEEMEKR